MTREEALEQAKKLIKGKRHDDYGSAREGFELQAQMMSKFLGKEISAVDVGVWMLVMKLSRILNSGKITIDTLIDLIGYAALLIEIITEKGNDNNKKTTS